MRSVAKAPGSALPLARLARQVMDPLAARRGLASAALLAAWDDVVGGRYAGITQPEKLVWPRGKDAAGILTVRVEGPVAVFLQHETLPFIERINRFLGFAAVAELRIVQRPIVRRTVRRPPADAPLPPDAAAALDGAVAGIEHERLRRSLRALGAGVMADRAGRDAKGGTGVEKGSVAVAPQPRPDLKSPA